MTILLIQDDPAYLEFLTRILPNHQHTIQQARNGLLGFAQALHAHFDLILLDTQTAGMDGIELVRRLRQENDSTPVLLLSTQNDTATKVRGLNAGADDYVIKSVDASELQARIFALYRRRTGGFSGPRILRVDNLELNIAEKAAYRGNKRIRLTVREFQLLEYLIENAGRVVTKTQILEKAWNMTERHNSNKVEVYINYLRNKVDREFDHKLIHTFIGLGYLLKPDI
ncbi:response regulator transcription factor [Spirosoma aerolatum]|uniref:response regulator transcription factor n=1 Tax=Spirosoma aerolatum TaxID=1211326 RepID=UPI0009AEAAC0|nr:response regulator transcription factor [Spirosoma aerolatum]